MHAIIRNESAAVILIRSSVFSCFKAEASARQGFALAKARDGCRREDSASSSPAEVVFSATACYVRERAFYSTRKRIIALFAMRRPDGGKDNRCAGKSHRGLYNPQNSN